MSCCVCASKFDAGARVPKVLPCGHSMCLACAANGGVAPGAAGAAGEPLEPAQAVRAGSDGSDGNNHGGAGITCPEPGCDRIAHATAHQLPTNHALLALVQRPQMPLCDAHGVQVCLFCTQCAQVGLHECDVRRVLRRVGCTAPVHTATLTRAPLTVAAGGVHGVLEHHTSRAPGD